MNRTPFPATPKEVVALTVLEFTCDLDLENAPSLDRVCNRFADDANRALVWWIRFRALASWRAREDTVAWLRAVSKTCADASEVAASFTLNANWEFDAEGFRSAIASATSRDAGHRHWFGR